MSKGSTLSALGLGDQVVGTVVQIYAATCNEDKNEGRGATIDNSYHTSQRSALIASRCIDVMGSDGGVDKRLAIKLTDGRHFLLKNDNQPIELTDDQREVEAAAELRTSALAKLTEAERAALNFYGL